MGEVLWELCLDHSVRLDPSVLRGGNISLVDLVLAICALSLMSPLPLIIQSNLAHVKRFFIWSWCVHFFEKIRLVNFLLLGVICNPLGNEVGQITFLDREIVAFMLSGTELHEEVLGVGHPFFGLNVHQNALFWAVAWEIAYIDANIATFLVAREAFVVQSTRPTNHYEFIIFDRALKGAFTVQGDYWFNLIR